MSQTPSLLKVENGEDKEDDVGSLENQNGEVEVDKRRESFVEKTSPDPEIRSNDEVVWDGKEFDDDTDDGDDERAPDGVDGVASQLLRIFYSWVSTSLSQKWDQSFKTCKKCLIPSN